MKIRLSAYKSFFNIIAQIIPKSLFVILFLAICGVLSGIEWWITLSVAAALIVLCAIAVLVVWLFTRFKFIYFDTINGIITYRKLFKTKQQNIADAVFKLIIYANAEFNCEYKLCVCAGGKKVFSINNTDMQEEFRKADFLETLQKYLNCEVIRKYNSYKKN